MYSEGRKLSKSLAKVVLAVGISCAKMSSSYTGKERGRKVEGRHSTRKVEKKLIRELKLKILLAQLLECHN